MARKKGTPRRKRPVIDPNKWASPTKAQWAAAKRLQAKDNAVAKRALMAVARHFKPKATSTPKSKKDLRRATRHPKMRKSKAAGKTCMTLMELTRAFPDVAQRICFYPKVSSYKSVVAGLPASKRKIGTWYKG